MIAFLIGLNFYKTGVEWAISKFSFLPESVSSTAKKRYEKMLVLSPHFSIIYMFREFLVLFALAYFIHSARLDKQMNYLKQQQLQAELKYLKVQLQPHFFFNTLNNIYSLTIEQSPKAAQLVARHSQMMRYILYDSSSHVVDLQKEIDFLLNYCKVESIRYNENIKIVFETQGINNKMMIEPLLLLPFIENTFKHGISEEINIGYVNILVCLNENELILETKNSKASGAIKNIGKGIGLTNAENRLKILYPDKYQIEVFEDDRNYFLYLTIKLRLNG